MKGLEVPCTDIQFMTISTLTTLHCKQLHKNSSKFSSQSISWAHSLDLIAVHSPEPQTNTRFTNDYFHFEKQQLRFNLLV